MDPHKDTWDGRDGDEGGAPEALSDRASGLLTAKLARHNREAEQLAEAMHEKRRRS